MDPASKRRLFSSISCVSILLLINHASAQFVPQEIIINSGRPTFFVPSNSIPGKIALEEHVGNSIFDGGFTTPFVNLTNELLFDLPIYNNDVTPRLTDINARVQEMDAANISINVLMFGPPGIQGFFNSTLATFAASFVNNETSRLYANGNFSSRFEFWCSNALIDPISAAAELERCVKTLGGIGSFVGGYTNNGSVNNVIYLDDPSNEPFLQKVVELDVPIYLHPREPPPNQQRVFQDFNFLAGSPLGFSTETAGHVLRLMVNGVFDKFPTLKIVLGHCGEGLPFFLPRIDERIKHFKHLWPAEHTMTYYWENNFYVTTSGVADSGALMDTLRRTGEDRVMFSVDYPFEDTVEMASWFDNLELNSNTKQKLAFQNARNLLKLGS